MIPLTNAAGWVKLPADVAPLLRVPNDILSAITLGSYTPSRRDGNPGTTFWEDGQYWASSLNALGLPNPGMEFRTQFRNLFPEIRASGKRVRVSIAGFSPEEYAESAYLAHETGPDEIEINFGCPNVRDTTGAQKPIMSFVPDLMYETLEKVSERFGDEVNVPLSVKLSPYSDPALIPKIAEVMKNWFPMVQKVVTCNTFPNGYGFDKNDAPLITANDGYAGVAGRALKLIALGQVRQFRKLLPPSIKVAGVGGISCGDDLRDIELAGASEAQVGTAFFLHGPGIFPRIAMEYANQYE